LLYALMLAAVGFAMLTALLLRSDSEINVLHDRNPLFVTLADGSVRNGYTVKILNKERAERTFRLEFKGVDGARLRVVGVAGAAESAGPVEVRAAPDAVTTYQIYVAADAARLASDRSDVFFSVTDVDKSSTATRHTWFYGPKP
jgi:polyferredoxin